MLPQERYAKIVNILLEKNVIRIADVMSLCGVSHETARRDLEAVQDAGIAKRVHGGAMLIPQSAPSPAALTIPVGGHSEQQHIGNVSVARAAAGLVRPGDTVMLDAGRTMAHIAHFLREIPDLTVVTTSLLVINELRDSDVNVHVLGGDLLHDEYVFIGKSTQNCMESLNVDIAFISCTGLDLKHRALTEVDSLGLSRSLIREHCDRLVLTVNSSKLKVRSFFRAATLDIVDTVIVDECISDEDRQLLEEDCGVKQLIVAPLLDSGALDEDLS